MDALKYTNNGWYQPCWLVTAGTDINDRCLFVVRLISVDDVQKDTEELKGSKRGKLCFIMIFGTKIEIIKKNINSWKKNIWMGYWVSVQNFTVPVKLAYFQRAELRDIFIHICFIYSSFWRECYKQVAECYGETRQKFWTLLDMQREKKLCEPEQ